MCLQSSGEYDRMSGMMTVARFHGAGKDMRIEQMPIPELADGDLLLKVRTCGICGSDARTYFNGIKQRYKVPIVFGHEIVAEVCETGANAAGLSAGDRVAVAPTYGCGDCRYCRSGRDNICDEVVVFGCTFDGGFAEYMRIPRKGVEQGALVKLTDAVSDRAGTMIEAFSCCYHGLKTIGVDAGDSVAIIGSGPIGLAHMLLAKKMGAAKVGMIGHRDNRLAQAESFGADMTVNSNNGDWKEQVFDFFGRDRVDKVVTAAPTTAAIDCGFEIVSKGGAMLLFGGLPKGQMITVDPNQVHYSEILIAGSIDAPVERFRATVELVASLDLDRFVTHSFGLADVVEGIEVIGRREGMKVILDLTEQTKES